VNDRLFGASLNTGTTLDAALDIDRHGFAVLHLIHAGWAPVGAIPMAGALVIVHFYSYFTAVPFLKVHIFSRLRFNRAQAAKCAKGPYKIGAASG
jgi:hypothetical protein